MLGEIQLVKNFFQKKLKKSNLNKKHERIHVNIRQVIALYRTGFDF
jgi:hypothetical protein